MDSNPIVFYHTTNKQVIDDAMLLVEHDHPNRVLHEWAIAVEDYRHVHFNLCFKGDDYVGYYCITYDGTHYYLHFGLMNNQSAKRVFSKAFDMIKQELHNYYNSNTLRCVIVDSDIIRIAERVGWYKVGDDTYEVSTVS